MFGPGVMVGSEVEADGVTIEARLLAKSADAAMAFVCMFGLYKKLHLELELRVGGGGQIEDGAVHYEDEVQLPTAFITSIPMRLTSAVHADYIRPLDTGQYLRLSHECKRVAWDPMT